MFGFDFKSLRRSVEGVEKKLQDMHKEVDDLRRQRERASTAPTSKEDLKALLSAWVASAGDQYRKALHETLRKFRNPRSLSSRELASVMSITGAPQPFGEAIRAQDVDQALCALFAPLLSKALLDEVDSMEWPADTVTTAERNATVARLDERIVQLDQEIKELTTAAEEAGITWSR